MDICDCSSSSCSTTVNTFFLVGACDRNCVGGLDGACDGKYCTFRVILEDTLDMLDIAVEGTFPISLWDSMVDGLNVDSADVYWDSDVKELAPDTEE
mmetsp:Transcript_17498/g.25731  ORF Transcript_17498/g.25731 Transcript_17498/m.25731 type:complete len:97 (+) Transcript_17498:636-926(+)